MEEINNKDNNNKTRKGNAIRDAYEQTIRESFAMAEKMWGEKDSERNS